MTMPCLMPSRGLVLFTLVVGLHTLGARAVGPTLASTAGWPAIHGCSYATVGEACEGEAYEATDEGFSTTSAGGRCSVGPLTATAFESTSTEEYTVGFYCRAVESAIQPCENAVEQCDGALDNQVARWAGFTCDTKLSMVEEQLPDQAKAEIEKSDIDLDEYRDKYIKDICLEMCDACSEDSSVSFSADDDDLDDAELEAIMAAVRDELCAAMGYMAVSLYGDTLDVSADCPLAESDAGTTLSAGRRLGAASTTIAAKLPVILTLEEIAASPALTQGGDDMGFEAVGGVVNMTATVTRPVIDEGGIGIMGVIIIIVVLVLCLLCCPICCCIYCCCCRKKKDGGNAAV